MKKTIKGKGFTATFTDENGYFSLTGECEGGGGAVGGRIAAIDSRFKLLSDLHLCDCKTGAPRHAVANALYYAEQGDTAALARHLRIDPDQTTSIIGRIAIAKHTGKTDGEKAVGQEITRCNALLTDIDMACRSPQTIDGRKDALRAVYRSLRQLDDKEMLSKQLCKKLGAPGHGWIYDLTEQDVNKAVAGMRRVLRNSKEKASNLVQKHIRAYTLQAMETVCNNLAEYWAKQAKAAYALIEELPENLGWGYTHPIDADGEPISEEYADKLDAFDDWEKAAAIAKYSDTDILDIEEITSDAFEVNGREYRVLTDEEADGAAADYIRESVWAFNAAFLSQFTGMPAAMFEAVQDQCEGANDAILKCIERAGGIKAFAQAAIRADGRGHFLSPYDGEEVAFEGYFIYRQN